MDTIYHIEKQANGEVLLRENERPLYRIQNQTVFRDQLAVWQIVHRGTQLFSGTWQIISLPEHKVLISYRYIASSYRYGEDLRIVHHGLDTEYLFRRVDPERDHWMLLTKAGDVVLESMDETSGTGVWRLRLFREIPEENLGPLICLLVFDRLACNRI